MIMFLYKFKLKALDYNQKEMKKYHKQNHQEKVKL